MPFILYVSRSLNNVRRLFHCCIFSALNMCLLLKLNSIRAVFFFFDHSFHHCSLKYLEQFASLHAARALMKTQKNKICILFGPKFVAARKSLLPAAGAGPCATRCRQRGTSLRQKAQGCRWPSRGRVPPGSASGARSRRSLQLTPPYPASHRPPPQPASYPSADLEPLPRATVLSRMQSLRVWRYAEPAHSPPP